MGFPNWLIEEARLVLLRLLNEMSSYRANSSTLQDQLDIRHMLNAEDWINALNKESDQ